MKKKVRIKPIFFVLVCAILLIIAGGIWIFLSSPVNSSDTKDIEIEVKSGESVSKIGKTLKNNNLIRSELLFKVYVKIYKVNSLKASTYKLKKSMNLSEIVSALEKGSNYNPDMIKLTFKEGESITSYAKVIGDNTNNSYDDVINTIKNKDYLKELISKYWFLTDEILNEQIYYPLEGYLMPETYHFDNKDVTVKEIINRMLDETEKNLEEYKSIIKDNPHYYMTMASIVELEGTNTENRKVIVGIFKNRLSSGFNMGSDVTTYYGLQVPMTEDLTTEQFASVNPYNTRSTTMIGKMPVGPICNPSKSSIEASAIPTQTDYMFFVADKNGKIYYTKTNAEHEKKIKEIKDNGDWIW